jgi:hypothetical protein
MKQARVSIIKDNINPGDEIPNIINDATIGLWVDHTMSAKGHKVDKLGVMDLPDLKIDNKTRKKGSKAPHTVGSMTTKNIIDTPNFEDTRLYKKVQNQNQIIYDTSFNKVISTRIVDMDISTTKEAFREIWTSLRKKVIAESKIGIRSKNIYSDCGRGILDGYGHNNSYRLRVTDKFMKQIQNIAGSRDTFTNLFELQHSI